MSDTVGCVLGVVKKGDKYVPVQAASKEDLDVAMNAANVTIPSRRNTIELEKTLRDATPEQRANLLKNLDDINAQAVNRVAAQSLVPSILGKHTDNFTSEQLQDYVERTMQDLGEIPPPSKPTPAPELGKEADVDTTASRAFDQGKADPATALEDNGLVLNNWFAKAINKMSSNEGIKIGDRRYFAWHLNPKLAMMNSPSQVARMTVQLIANNEFLLNKELKGIAKPVSLESMVMRWDGVLGETLHTLQRHYDTYAKRVKAEDGTILNQRDFGVEVSRGLRSKKSSGIPELDDAIAMVRTEIFDKTTNDLKKFGLLEPKEPQIKAAYENYKREQEDAGRFSRDVSFDDFKTWVSDYRLSGNLNDVPPEFRNTVKNTMPDSKKLNELADPVVGMSLDDFTAKAKAYNIARKRLAKVKRKDQTSFPTAKSTAAWQQDLDNATAGVPKAVLAIFRRMEKASSAKGRQKFLDQAMEIELRANRQLVRDQFKMFSETGEALPEQILKFRKLELSDNDLLKRFEGVERRAVRKRAKDTDDAAILNYDDFKAATMEYGRTNGKSGAYAKVGDDSVFVRQIKEAAELTVVGAEGYLPRFYRFDLIQNRYGEFEADLIKFFSDNDTRVKYGYNGNKLTPEEAKEIAREVGATILGWNTRTGLIQDDIIIKAGPLKDKTVDVPDEFLERWIVNDVDEVMQKYMRQVVPQIEAGRMGLSHEMLAKELNADYDRLLDEAGDDLGKIAELNNRRQMDMDNTVHLFNAAMGQLQKDVKHPKISNALGFMRDLNFMRLLGNVVVSSLADMGRNVMLAGFGDSLGTGLKRLSSQSFREMSEESLRSIGGASEIWLNTRYASILGDDIAAHSNIGWLRRFSSGGAKAMGKWSGIQRWNHENKVLAGILSQDQLIKNIRKAAAGDDDAVMGLARAGISKENIQRLDDMLARDAKEVQGVNLANIDDWPDEAFKHEFQASILKDIERTIVTPGIGDKPKIMTTDIGSTLLQFRSFQFGGLNKMLLPFAQDPWSMNNVVGLNMMIFIGGMAAASKLYLAGRGDDWEAMGPQEMAREAIDNSGIMGVFMESFNISDKMMGGKLSRAMGMTGEATRYRGKNILDNMAGPTFGLLGDVFNAAYSLSGNSEFKQTDFHRMRKLFPYQNIFYLRSIVDSLEVSTGKALGLEQNANIKPYFELF